jgi:hypothetical protein
LLPERHRPLEGPANTIRFISCRESEL